MGPGRASRRTKIEKSQLVCSRATGSHFPVTPLARPNKRERKSLRRAGCHLHPSVDMLDGSLNHLACGKGIDLSRAQSFYHPRTIEQINRPMTPAATEYLRCAPSKQR